MIRAGLFDLDGTLLDSMYVWTHVDACFFARRGLEMPSDYPRAISGMSFVDTARYTKARFDLPEDVEEIMAEWTALAREEYALRGLKEPSQVTEENIDDILAVLRARKQ